MTSKIGDIIQSGESIPDDVTALRDNDGDDWYRAPRADYPWGQTPGRGGYTALGLAQWYPLAVTAVREPEPDPSSEPGRTDCYMMATNAIHKLGDISRDVPSLAIIYGEEGDDLIGEWVTGIGYVNVRFPKATTRELTAEERAEYNGKLIDTAGAVRPIVISEPEPQQVDTSTLLDLVRQYGDKREHALEMLQLADREELARKFAQEADALFDRIAALLPQQPVQARSGHELLWQHGCEQVRIDINQPGPFGCGTLGCTGPWRPLLVGGDPRPDRPAIVQAWKVALAERDEARAEAADYAERLKAVNRSWTETARQRDEYRAEVERLRVEHRNGDGCSHFDRLLSVLDAENLRQALAEIERLKAAQPDPLVLSLPEVPRKDVTLVGAGGARFVPVGGASWQAKVEGGRSFGLGELIDLAGPLTVEMAPPREPRTWPKLDGAPDDLKAVKGASGLVYPRDPSGLDIFGPSRMSLSTLQRTDGPLTEVFDDEPGGTA